MKTVNTHPASRPDILEDITRFYDEATVDYAYWSERMNMHYGYLKHWKQFFKREDMLEQLTREVADRLQLTNDNHILDLGCGTGASARTMTELDSTVHVTGVNVVASHVEQGKALNRTHMGRSRMNLLHADYHHVPLPNAVADGAFAMESMCHSYNKNLWLQEAHRLLKPGARLVITDCFLRNPHKPMNKLSKWAYNRFRINWSVPHLAEIRLFEDMAKEVGFQQVKVEDVRWRVAPSVFHSPFVVGRFLWNRLIRRKHNGEQTVKNLKAVLLSIILGLDRRNFSYYIVTLTR